MGVCNCSMFCCTLLYVHSSIAIILMGKRELIALLNLSFWCLVMVERLFLAVPLGCLQFVIVVFPDQTHLLFLAVNDSTLSDTPNVRCLVTLYYIPTHGTMRNCKRMITATLRSANNKSKATSSLFPSQMTKILERTLITAKQGPIIKVPQTMGAATNYE